jgi:hypothetical protein
MTFGLDLGPNARNRVVEAIADRTLVVSFLEVDGNSQVALLKLNFPSIVDNGTTRVAAKFVFLGAKFDSFYIGLYDGTHSGERYRLAFLTAAGAEERIFLVNFTERTAVR